MKKLLIIAFLLLYSNIYAQTIDTSTYSKKIEYLFQNIEKPANAGIWYDKAMPFAALQDFDTTQKQQVTAQYFKQACYELLIADDKKEQFMAFHNALQQRKAIGVIPLGLIDAQIYFVDSNAVKMGILTQRGTNMPFRKSKQGQIFQQKQVLMSALLHEKPLKAHTVYPIEVSADFFLQHNSQNISQIVLSAEGKSHVFASPYNNKTINLSFTQAGTHTLQIKVLYQDASWVLATTQIEVMEDNIAMRTIGDPCFLPQPINTAISAKANIQADISFTDYEGRSFRGMGEVAYYYATSKGCDGQKSITKPLIIIDGFDPQDERSVGNIYTERLSYNNESDNLGRKLRDQGYDVIILNFPMYNVGSLAVDGGADYIQRNAFTLVKLIQQTNAQLQANGSTEQLVIVGPSMGGLISRYALAYMEKNGLNHNTRLWISFDSPHNGANIPIGAQRFLKFYGDDVGMAAPKESLEIQLNNPAAKQMLLDHFSAITNRYHLAAANIYRALFKIGLEANGLNGSKGFPVNLRKISLVNGSIAAERFGIAGQHVFQLRGYATALWGLINLAKVTEGNIRFSGSNGVAKNSFNAYYNNKSDYIDSRSPSISYDIAPGGWYRTVGIVEEQTPQGTTVIKPRILGWLLLNPFLGGIMQKVEADVYQDKHSFIPTKSALAYMGTNPDLGEALNNRNLICSNETPFDAYYAPINNEEHTQLSTASVAWLMEQLNLPAEPPQNYYTAVSGSGLACNGAAYQVQGLIRVPVLWEVSGTLQILSGQGTQSIQIAPLAGSSGTGWVRALSGGTCRAIQKNIWVGTPNVQRNDIGTCPDPAILLRATFIEGAHYYWTIDNPDLSYYAANNELTIFSYGIAEGDNRSFEATVHISSGNCSSSAVRAATIIKPVNCGGGGLPVMLRINPNPSAEQVEISLEDA